MPACASVGFRASGHRTVEPPLGRGATPSPGYAEKMKFMLIRFVRMTFQPQRLAEFTRIFDASKSHIRAFPGCHHLELLGDLHHPNVRMTRSVWESEAALTAYRQSELFRSTWAATKILFADIPVAYSTEVIETVLPI